MKRILFIFLMLSFSSNLLAQTPEERAKIVSHYDLNKLNKLETLVKQKEEKRIAKTIDFAKKNHLDLKGVQTIKTKNGEKILNSYYLRYITPDGKPIYYETKNYYSAKSIQTDKLYNGGGMGLNLQGQNMIVGLWDGGPVRLTHQLINGRVVQRDGITFSGADDNNRHAMHVTGTMIGGGAGPLTARGMAFQAHEWAHDWFYDNSEMISEASQGLLISNHSYGMRAFGFVGNRLIDLYWFGKYADDAHDWDDIMYNAPYYLVVDAAGNDRQYAAQGPNKGGYDMLTGNSTMKNGLTVAAVNRVNNYTGPNSVSMSSFSNWGPTDDGRIKPDISAQGVNLYSSVSDSNTSYDTYSGTSMAAPSVTGSAILLQQHFNETYGNYMRASTLKGLILHTANEAGNTPGPDYRFGWGLMNTARAAQTITDNGLNSEIREVVLNDGDTYSFTVTSNGTDPLMASISWTDPAGNVITGTAADLLDNPTPALVNDLDIRVTKNGNTYFPWRLNLNNPSAAATKGDNTVDNFEKVQVDNASGTYTITVSHKGSLEEGKQAVSIIVTGITNPFAINSLDGDIIPACVDNNPNLTIHFKYRKNSSTSGTTHFSVTGLPSGANASFSPASLSSDGNFDLNITGLNNVPSGIYNLVITGTNGNITREKPIQIHVLKSTFPQQNLVSPVNGAHALRRPIILNWEPNPNAETYLVEVAYASDFSNLLGSQEVTGTTLNVDQSFYGVDNGYTYYWRVKPKNRCWEGNFSPVWNFETIPIECSQGYNTTAVTIPSTANTQPITSTIDFQEDKTIEYVKVFVSINHTQISDLEIKVNSPLGTEVILNNAGTCAGNYQDIQVTYNDAADDFVVCNHNAPAIRDEVKPYQPLSLLQNQSSLGLWTLEVDDPVDQNGGTLNMWVLEVCSVNAVDSPKFDKFNIWPNPSKGQIHVEISTNEDVNLKLYDLSGRAIYDQDYTNNSDKFTKNIILGHLKKGVYLLKVSSGEKQETKRIIIK